MDNKDLDSPTLTSEQAHEILAHIESARGLLNTYAHLSQSPVIPRRKSWWGRHCWPNKRRFLYRFVTIITVFIQVLNLTIISVIDTWPRRDSEENDFLVASSVSMIALQLINLVFLILASGRLVKQIFHHSVNGLFLAQSYGASILLFAGLYTLTYRLEKQSWRFVSESFDDNPVQVFVLYAKFLFYSISTATLCGSDNVLPVDWYNCVFAGFQMLLSFCYFASILGSAMGHEKHNSLFSPHNLETKSQVLPSDQHQRNSPEVDGPTSASTLLVKESHNFHKKKKTRPSSAPVSPDDTLSLTKAPTGRTLLAKGPSAGSSIQCYSAMGSSGPALLIDDVGSDDNLEDERDFGDRLVDNATVHYMSNEEKRKQKPGRLKQP